MTYVGYPKATLLIDSGPSKHLHVIVTHANKNDQFLLIPISTIKDGKFHDPQCIIVGGEHTFLSKNSFAYYKNATVTDARNLAKCVDGQIYIPRDDVSDDLLNRICDGITKSIHTPRFAIEFFEANK